MYALWISLTLILAIKDRLNENNGHGESGIDR